MITIQMEESTWNNLHVFLSRVSLQGAEAMEFVKVMNAIHSPVHEAMPNDQVENTYED